MNRLYLLLAWALGLLPLFWWVWLGFTDGLTANPAQYLTLSSGEWALAGLCLVLAATPLRRVPGLGWLMVHRRLLGLCTFFYASLHVLAWAWWEQGFGLQAMWADVLNRLFIALGLVAFVLLMPLALTSTRGWMRRLGPAWKRLHRLVYLSVALSLWHFWLVRAGKNDFADVWVYAGLVCAALVFRRVGQARNRKSVG